MFCCRCVVEKDPDATWYMSKAFQQTSLSAEGLFMTDSGIMKAARVINKETLFIRCLIGFCISDGTEPNLCTNVSTVKPVLSSHSTIEETKILMTNGRLMKIERITEACCNTFDLH